MKALGGVSGTSQIGNNSLTKGSLIEGIHRRIKKGVLQHNFTSYIFTCDT